MTNQKVFSSINGESIGDKFFMFDNGTIQHSFLQDFLTQTYESMCIIKLEYSIQLNYSLYAKN